MLPVQLLRLIICPRLEVGVGGSASRVPGGSAERERVREMEADERLRGDLDLLSLGDGIGAGAEAAACGSSNSCSFAAAENAAKNCPDGCPAAHLCRRVLAASLTGYAVRLRRDGDVCPTAFEAGELDGEQRVAFEVGGFLHGI